MIKKLFFSFCWVCVLCTATQAMTASPSIPNTLTASRIETAVAQKEMACKP